MSSNLAFFTACFQNEIASTAQLIRSLPTASLDYRAHPVNRSAREIVEHLLGHIVDLAVIARESRCDETLVFPVTSSEEAASQFEQLSADVQSALAQLTDAQWENDPVELLIHGKSFLTIPRANMMWFFFFDCIHHRGQLSTQVRPMGGKVPAIYGFSADAPAAG
jgi:uncharacterized damage-inducible protein DinB